MVRQRRGGTRNEAWRKQRRIQCAKNKRHALLARAVVTIAMTLWKRLYLR
jgi:hypothetical protein